MRINPVDPSVRTKRRPKESKEEVGSPWYKFGTDAQFRRFIRGLPCCICGVFRAWVDGVGQSEAAHVRLGGRGGTAYKPPFSAVPMCRLCHHRQTVETHEVFGSKDFWLQLVEKYLRLWANREGR